MNNLAPMKRCPVVQCNLNRMQDRIHTVQIYFTSDLNSIPRTYGVYLGQYGLHLGQYGIHLEQYGIHLGQYDTSFTSSTI